jgi:YD repeat-containing protein
MKQRCSSSRYSCALLIVLTPAVAFGQSTTFHLHKENSKTSGAVLQLKAVGPDAPAASLSVDLRKRPTGVYPIKDFDTAAGSPNLSGVIPAGSMASMVLWVRKTTNAGVIYPRATLRLNAATGATLCEATDVTPLTTTVTPVTVTCATSANVAIASTDRFFLRVAALVSTAPGNTAIDAELRIEGTLNGNYDSRVTIPLPVPPPAISALAPTTGPVGTSVSIFGTNFGASQASSVVTFNGVAAVPTSWASDRITARVPSGASSGQVVVRVQGLASNGAAFTVTDPEPFGRVTYAYDALDRLIQVTSASGQSAIYHYDAAGNILGIDRPGAGGGSSIAIGGFAPAEGPIGTAVTITGAGFSPTITQNTVTFNGVPATVSAASATQLAAVVPGSATTGPIGVTSPAGSATTSAPFTVRADSGAPTIAGFTPTVGVTGTPVTLTGTNFQTTPADNRVTLNIRPADVGASTATTLTTAVPLASMGGRVTVETPFGTAVAASDFVVVPSPYMPADVEFSQRIAIGQSQNVSITTAGRIALLLFDATAGRKVSVTSVSNTWTSCPIGAQYTLSLYGPDASLVRGMNNACGTTTLMDQQTAPLTGTYTLMLDPSGSNTGSATVTAYTFADVTGPISADGTPVSVSLPSPGQNARLTFTGTAGQIVSGLVSSATIPGYCGGPYAFYLTLVRPDGSTQASIPSCGGGVFLDRQALSMNGTYTLMLDPVGTSTGDAIMRLYTVVDVVMPATDGTGIPVSITTPGQNARFTFSGTPGQVVTGLVSNATIPGFCGGAYAFALTLLRPDGSMQASIPSCGGSVFLDRQTLSMTGMYTLQLDPVGTSTGDATVTLYTIVDVVQPIADATTVAVVLTTPGQNGRFTFNGSPGQIVSGLVSNATIPGYCGGPYAFYLTLVRPDGSTQASIPSCGGGVFLDRQTLSMTGTYTLMLDPVGTSTGRADVTLYTVVDVTGSIVPNGASVPVSITKPGQNALLTFDGTAGQVVTASTANNTIPGFCGGPYAYRFSILKPDGSTLVGSPSCGGNLSFGQRTLPVSGIYTLLLDPVDWHTGSITITLTSP